MQLVEQRFTQHTRVVPIPQAQIHYLLKKQAQASLEPVTNAAGTQANSCAGRLHSDSRGDTTAGSAIVTYSLLCLRCACPAG